MTDGRESASQELTLAFSCYWLGLVLVLAGVAAGVDFLPRQSGPNQNESGFANAFGAWDGWWYAGIVNEGYAFDEERPSNVAFFPAYPLLSHCLHRLTGLSAYLSLLAVAHVCLISAFVLLGSYVRQRFPANQDLPEYALVSFALMPMTLFFRMTYSESLFVLITILVMFGRQRHWPAWVTALIAGAATGTRSLGVALLLPLAWDWWQRAREDASSGCPASELPAAIVKADAKRKIRETFNLRNVRRFVLSAAVLGPLASWGLLANMAYEHLEFGDAFAFVRTQAHWEMRPDLPWPRRLVSLASLEPIWSIYVPSSEAYWARHDYVANPLFSLQFWNPIYFLACAGLVAFGAWRRWLTPPEWLLSAGLLGIPYVLQGYRMMMLGHGRFTCVVFPMYIVLAHILSGVSRPAAILICVLMGVQLFYWSAMFAAWHRVF